MKPIPPSLPRVLDTQGLLAVQRGQRPRGAHLTVSLPHPPYHPLSLSLTPSHPSLTLIPSPSQPGAMCHITEPLNLGESAITIKY